MPLTRAEAQRPAQLRTRTLREKDVEVPPGVRSQGSAGELDDVDELPTARRSILAAASAGGLSLTLAMLEEALQQMDILGPAVSAEVWSEYAAVLEVAATDRPRAP